MFKIIALALALSIDAFSLGLSFGIRKIKVPISSFIIIATIGFLFISSSLIFGDILMHTLPPNLSSVIGGLLLIGIGSWIIIQSQKTAVKKIDVDQKPKEIFHFIIKSLGITINIVRTPEYSDLNHSNIIEPKEAIYMGTALSIDAIGVCVGSVTTGAPIILLPILAITFQAFFILSGMKLGKKLSESSNNNHIWSLLSGSLIILIGLIQLLGIA